MYPSFCQKISTKNYGPQTRISTPLKTKINPNYDYTPENNQSYHISIVKVTLHVVVLTTGQPSIPFPGPKLLT